MTTKPVRFYLVRHGQTWTNLRKMMIGGAGSAPLTPVGRQAAKYLGLGLRDIPFVAAYSSPLSRAKETAALALLGRELPVQTEDGLRDVFWGDLEGGIPEDVVKMKESLPEDDLFPLGSLNTPEYRSAFGGETIFEYVNRFEQTLREIGRRHQETGGNILVVSHAALGSFLYKHGGGGEMDTANISGLHEVSNTSVSIASWENDTFRIISVNDLSYIVKGKAMAESRKPLQIVLFGDVETIFAAKGLLEGCSDSCLSKKGIADAENLHNAYLGTDFSAVYYSPLDRAKVFQDIVFRDRNIPAKEKEALREIALGYWEVEKKERLWRQYPKEMGALEQGGDALLRYRPPMGGESGAVAAVRLETALREIGERHEFDGKSVAIFSHPMVLRAFFASLAIPAPEDYSKGEAVIYRYGSFETINGS